MFKSNKSHYLNKIIKNWIYCLIFILTIALFFLANTHLVKSQAIFITQSIPSSKENRELVGLEEFSDMISKIENTWENDYEGYFRRDFLNRNRPATKIAEHLTEIHQQAGIRPAVIWAVPLDDFLELILITPDKQFVVKKIRGANKELLTKRIKELEAGITDYNSLEYLPPARLLYQWIFKPLEPYLEAEKIDTLLLCTGTTLRSLPFATLHDGDKFLVEKYNIALIPAFNLTDTDYKFKPEKQVLAMGTSEFDDLPSLPGIMVELETIVPKLWSGRKLIDRAFTVENLIDTHKQGNFDIIHIASHSQFNPGSPENSYIQFSDRKLSLDRLASLELNLPQVDLLVLSSCETAVGNPDAEFGFAGLAIQAGVKSALASLWGVNDTATVALMSKFYQQLRTTPIKSLALRKAQISMLKQQLFVEDNKIKGLDIEVNLPPTITTDESKNFQHPYYWAGFTIIGNPW
jgi:CHAT domain-containing protein